MADLISLVIDQIVEDVNAGNTDAIYALLESTGYKSLVEFLCINFDEETL